MSMQTGNHQLQGSRVPSEGKFYCRKIFKKIGATPKEILPVAKVYREAFRPACQENRTVSPLRDKYSGSFYRFSTQIGRILEQHWVKRLLIEGDLICLSSLIPKVCIHI